MGSQGNRLEGTELKEQLNRKLVYSQNTENNAKRLLSEIN